ncbi:MAG: ATP-binding protein [Bacteroidetes bacterium]|nr:ATP-binding protein [Bacteroidota bacterium]
MRHIRTKFLILFVTFGFSALFLTGWLISYEMEKFFYGWLIKNLEKQTAVLFTTFELEKDHGRAFAETIARAGGFRITLIGKDGRVLYDSEIPQDELPYVEKHDTRPEIIDAAKHGTGTNIRYSTTVKTEYLYFATKVSPEHRKGFLTNAEYLRLCLPLADVKSVIHGIRLEVVIASASVLVLMIIASVLLSRSISRPLVSIAQVAREIQQGNLERRIFVQSNDEIGEVAKAVNSMVEQLNADIAQLKKLEKIRSEFLGNVSHELRTPIFMLQGYLETLLDGALNDPLVNREFVEKAHANAMRLNTLLRDLIEISRIESGDMKMSFRYFPISDLLESVVEEFQPHAEAKALVLRGEYVNLEKTQRVYGDKERLLQALTNLVDNAIKYTPSGGTIIVRARDGGEVVHVDVQDSGIGIAPEHHDRIFERFYRVDKERSREAGGTGLGLAIVKHIIEAHGSKVNLTSEVGKGSLFSFALKK